MVAGLLLCVAASRAVTSAFATMLRSRRTRDLAAILLAVLAALLGPLQIAVLAGAERADCDRRGRSPRVVGWTPFGAPYTVGLDVADGPARGPRRSSWPITLAAIGALLWWWSRSLESAMVGTPRRRRRVRRGAAPRPAAPVAQLFPRPCRWLPPRTGTARWSRARCGTGGGTPGAGPA